MKCYIAVGGDIPMTQDAVASLQQEFKHENIHGEIILINNTENSIKEYFSDTNITILDMPVALLHGQSINLMLKLTIHNNDPFCMALHNDAELKEGALYEILDYYEQIKDTKWGAICLGHNNGDAFVLWNPLFNTTENVWHNPFLFPMYYMDNHYYRIMQLRGWNIHHTDNDLIIHSGSHMIKNNIVWRRTNDIVFKYHGLIYKEIWGGYPGGETVVDPTARGLCP